jgi:hypothetical protein
MIIVCISIGMQPGAISGQTKNFSEKGGFLSWRLEVTICDVKFGHKKPRPLSEIGAWCKLAICSIAIKKWALASTDYCAAGHHVRMT